MFSRRGGRDDCGESMRAIRGRSGSIRAGVLLSAQS
jgi:hypothetical protein